MHNKFVIKKKNSCVDINWLNYSFTPSICHEILVWSSSFSLSQFRPHFLKVQKNLKKIQKKNQKTLKKFKKTKKLIRDIDFNTVWSKLTVRTKLSHF